MNIPFEDLGRQRRPGFWASRTILPIIFLAAALRFAGMGAMPLWYDEVYSIGLATQPLGRLVANLAIDTHPPAYYALLRLSLSLIGENTIGVRWVSGAAGILTVALLYLIGRKTIGVREGSIMAFVLAVHPAHILLSQDGKNYALVTLFVVLLWWQINRLSATFSGRLWIGWVVSLMMSLAVNWPATLMWLGALLLDGFRRIIVGLHRRKVLAIWTLGLICVGVIAVAYVSWSTTTTGGWQYRPPTLQVPSLHNVRSLLALWGARFRRWSPLGLCGISYPLSNGMTSR